MSDPAESTRGLNVSDDEMLRAFVAVRDAPCPVCGYNLRGLLDTRCPECGRRLMLAVGTTEPRLGSFITGMVGLSSGLGFSALLLMYIVFQRFIARTGFSPSGLEVALLLAGLAIGGGGLAIWVKMRRRLGRASEPVRWGAAAAAWMVGLTFPVLFLVKIG